MDGHPDPVLAQTQKLLIRYITKEHIIGTIHNQQMEEHTVTYFTLIAVYKVTCSFVCDSD